MKEQERIELKEEIRAKEQEIRELKEEIRGVEMELANASGTEARSALEAKLQFLQQQIISRDQLIICLRDEIKSRNQQLVNLQQERTSLRSVQADEFKDRSEAWIRHMLLP